MTTRECLHIPQKIQNVRAAVINSHPGAPLGVVGVVVVVGIRCLVLSVGYCLPSRRTPRPCGVLGGQRHAAVHVETDPTRRERPDRCRPNRISSLSRSQLLGRDVIGSYLMTHVERPDREPGGRVRGQRVTVWRVCRSRWAFLVIARTLPLSPDSKRPPTNAEGLTMSAMSPLGGVVFFGGLVRDSWVHYFRVYAVVSVISGITLRTTIKNILPARSRVSEILVSPEGATIATRRHGATVHDERSGYAMRWCRVSDFPVTVLVSL